MSADPVHVSVPIGELVAHLNRIRPPGTDPIPDPTRETEEKSA